MRPKGKFIGPGAKLAAEGQVTQEAFGSSQHGSSAETPRAEDGHRRYDSGPVDVSRIVQKPISRTQADDPREHQIQQLRRRFSPKETLEKNGNALTFTMVPSDPDFPFEMAGLDCVLHVPDTYPKNGNPSLDVRNKEMGRGYQINVERGFDKLRSNSPKATLLALMNGLDRQLESLLTEQKAETVKIIPNVMQKPIRVQTVSSSNVKPSSAESIEVSKAPQTYNLDQKRIAQARRENEVRQLEARLGRLPLYEKSSDGIAYTFPIEPRRRADLPTPLQVVKTIRLFVPMLYPLQPCRIEIQGVAKEAASNTETGFETKAKENSEMTLMGHINHLSQNMHVLATDPVKKHSEMTVDDLAISSLNVEEPHDGPSISDKDTIFQEANDDRNHIQIIPRPPEWTFGGEGDANDGTDSSDSYDSGDEFTDNVSDGGPDTAPGASSTAPERGILLSFPFLELRGIELLELVSLCVTIKCERCKDTMDVGNLRNSSETGSSKARTESCKKCASQVGIGKPSSLISFPCRVYLTVLGFRKELMHANSVRAGYLDLDGCTVVDMLPRYFVSSRFMAIIRSFLLLSC